MTDKLALADQLKRYADLEAIPPGVRASMIEAAALLALPAANTAGDVREEIATKAIEIANSVRYAAQLMHDGRSSADPDKLRWLHHGWGADEVRSKLDDWRDTLSTPTPAVALALSVSRPDRGGPHG